MNQNTIPGKNVTQQTHFTGLTENEVIRLRQQFGENKPKQKGRSGLIKIIWNTISEPMFILLSIACLLYFILGENTEGFMMLAAMALVTAISFYQENRSVKALEALKQYTEPKVTVIREGIEKTIAIEELVPGDYMILEEGALVPADAEIIQSNDLSAIESILTGESFPVDKNEKKENKLLYQGTTINSGKSIARVSFTGSHTRLARLGMMVTEQTASKTLLQRQVVKFVRRLAGFGFVAFLFIFAFNYIKTDSFSQSLLFGLTLAMAAIPEEIPIAFTSFMALGAYYMSRLGIITRQPHTIENLGAVTVICLDKTGTITENRMEVKTVYDYKSDKLFEFENNGLSAESSVLYYAMLASESGPFDMMEKAIYDAYERSMAGKEKRISEMIYEYPLEGRPPMMTHVYRMGDNTVAAAKGAAERIMDACRLDAELKSKITGYVKLLAGKGFRVLGVAGAMHIDEVFPEKQDEFAWKFEGLVALYDPPKKDIEEVFRQFREAKIKLKLLTGDYPETAVYVAEQTGMSSNLKFYGGEEVMNMNDEELKTAVQTVNLYARMFPEAKLKVIRALQSTGEVAAMTGDGVNDGPALKASDIGIAMGKKGTEMAKLASDIVLTDDKLEKVVEAVRHGRKIYSNLKKAIRYIISIHIPIILTAALPVILGWKYPNIFTPIHVIFLELIMGPTCSIFFEREPAEKNIMHLSPRNRTKDLFRQDEILISVVQGLVITAGVLLLYYIYMNNEHSIEKTRMMVFSTLILSNIFLTFVNRSFTENFTKTIFYKNNLAPWILILSLLFLSALHFIPIVRDIFGLASVNGAEFMICCITAFISVAWFEIYKTDLKKLYQTVTGKKHKKPY
jgi:Ca2+-transporting ATPase